MEDLIKALQIFAKYSTDKYPTICEHDILYVCVEEEMVSEEDVKELDELGFFPHEDGFASYRFGSC